MKKVLLLFVLLFSFGVYAQENTDKKEYTQAEFPGGQAALIKYLAKNTQYPKEAKEKDKSGKVTVFFVINKNGKTENVKVVNGICPSIDKEAVRVVETMPKWKPATKNGEAVETTYSVPITFLTY